MEERYLDSGSEADDIEEGRVENDSDEDNLSLNDFNLEEELGNNISVKALHK